MEVVLQWLDELEDHWFAVPLLWERWRPRVLGLGLMASVLLHGCQLMPGAGFLAPLFAALALCTISCWLAAWVVDRTRSGGAQLSFS